MHPAGGDRNISSPDAAFRITGVGLFASVREPIALPRERLVTQEGSPTGHALEAVRIRLSILGGEPF